MNKYETPELNVVQITARETIADESDNSVIVSAGQLYPFPKN